MNSLYCVMMSSRIRCANSEASATFLLSRTCSPHSRSLCADSSATAASSTYSRDDVRGGADAGSRCDVSPSTLTLTLCGGPIGDAERRNPRGLEPSLGLLAGDAPTTPGLNLVVSDTGDRNDAPFDAANVVEISLRRSATRAKLSTVTRPFSSLRTSSNAPRTPGAVALSASRCFSAASTLARASSSFANAYAAGERGETATRGAARSSRSSKLLNAFVPSSELFDACERRASAGDLARNASMRARNSSISRSRGRVPRRSRRARRRVGRRQLSRDVSRVADVDIKTRRRRNNALTCSGLSSK